jgi:CRP/FNR family transcriptional regulator
MLADGHLYPSSVPFKAPMTRASRIANYLGLTLETISRLLTRYRQLGLLESNGHEIPRMNLPALYRCGEAQPLKHSA